MTEILFRAPSYDDNFSGDRDFAYVAEVDVLGWKFRKMANGTLVIETPRATPDSVDSAMMMKLSPELLDLIGTLANLDEERHSDLGDGFTNVGRFVEGLA